MSGIIFEPATFFFACASSHMRRTEVNPAERETLNEQSSLAQKLQEGASLGTNTSSVAESKSAPPVDETEPEGENSKFTLLIDNYSHYQFFGIHNLKDFS